MARNSKGELNEKQLRFVAEYLIDLNGKQAAIRAGYSARTAEVQASQLLRNPKVVAEFEKRNERHVSKIGVDVDYVLGGIKDTVERCRQAVPVFDKKGKQVMVETPDGSIVPAYTFQAVPAMKGFELLGKYLKLFADRHEHTGKDGGPIVFTLRRVGDAGTSPSA